MIGKHVVIDTLDNFKAKLDQIPSSAIVLIKDVGQIYAHGTYFGAQKTYSLLTKTADGLAPKGGTSASSQISDVDTEWVLTVTNGENPTWRKLPANAFSLLQYTLLSATVSDLGGIKVGQVYTATFDDLVGQYYKVNIDKNGLAYVHVPWVNNPYTASGNGITLKDNVFSLSLNSVTKLDSAIGNKIYAVSLDKNGKLCVSVPWTDTNNIFVGATETKNGSSGMVPAPIANQHNYFLRGDGTWVKPSLSNFTDDVVNGKYLPLSGGELSGDLIITAGNFIVRGSDAIVKQLYPSADNSYNLGNSSRYWANIYTMKINGGTPWHSGNDGSGSGLDADLLDGYHANSFMTFKHDGNNYVNASFVDENLAKVANDYFIEFWDTSGGWFNSKWGKITANDGFVGNLTGNADTATASEQLNKTWVEDINYGKGSCVKIISTPGNAAGQFPQAYCSGLSVMSSYVGWQLASYGGAGQNPWFRSLQDTGIWKPWRKLAFIDDTVADSNAIGGYSADRLYVKQRDFVGGKNILSTSLTGGGCTTATSGRNGTITWNVESEKDAYFYIYTKEAIQAGEKLVLSFDVSGINASDFTSQWFWKNVGTEGKVTIKGNGRVYMYVSNATAVGADGQILIDDQTRVGNTSGQSGPITFSNFKLERGEMGSDFSFNPFYVALKTDKAPDSDKLDGVDGSLYARRAAANDLVFNGNEVTMVPSQYSGELWFNYRTTAGTDGNITKYRFGNGKGSTTGVTLVAETFAGNATNATTATYAKSLVTSDDKPMVHFASNTLYIGDTIYTNYPTNVLGKSIKLRYGSSAETGLMLTDTGKVGIGTDSPSSKLEVYGGISLFEQLNFTRESWNYISVPATSGVLAFNIGKAGTANVKMVLANNGNVGIGTSSPGHKLEVDGNIRADVDILSGGSAYIAGNCFIGSGQEGIYLNKNGISWHNSENAWTNSIVKITSDGKVGIGVEPSETLHVSGNLKVTGSSYLGSTTGCDVYLQRTNGNNYITAGNALMFCVDGSSSNYALGIASSTKNATFYGNVTAPSFIKSGSSDDYVLLGGGGHAKIHGLVEYGLENYAYSFKGGGQTSVANNIVTFTGVNSDTYFYINLTQTIDYTIPYTVGVYVENWSGTGSWSFGVGAQNNGNFVLTITKNGWNWATGYFTSGLNGAASFALDDTSRPSPAPTMKISKAVVVKGTARPHYTPPLSKLSYYLPIGGGTLTGDLRLDTYLIYNNTHLDNWNVTRSTGALRVLHVGSSSTTTAPKTYCSGLSVMSKYCGFQLATWGGSENELYFRSETDTDVWQAWRTVACKDYVYSNYLPLTGGTLANTGTVLHINRTEAGSVPHINFMSNGTDVGDIGVDSSKNLVYYSGSWKKVWHEGNLTPSNYLLASNYTAADVLAKIKTVDGSGSGLDADTLDGRDSTSFVYSTGTYNLKPNAGCYRPQTSYIAIRLANVNAVWTMMCMELLIREHYGTPTYGKVILQVDKNNSNTLSGGQYYVLGKLSSSFKIYAAWDGTYFTVYLAGSWAYDSMTVQEVLFGDTAAGTSNKVISVTGVNSLPSSYVTLSMKNYYTEVTSSAGTNTQTIYFVT